MSGVTSQPGAVARTRIRVRGRVQGVGYRPWVYAVANQLGLTGWVRNDAQGVLVEVQGQDCNAFVQALRDAGPPTARVDGVEAHAVDVCGVESGFSIVESTRGGGTSVAIGPDGDVCDACLQELFDPSDRRYRYAFINCTHCGPRYTITRGLPYDRPQTSMARFAMCPQCSAEYHDPASRRFHAQPVACPACGPQLSMSVEDAWIALCGGAIGALKGLGGFLLACDARNRETVNRLRSRKQRNGKPFAVMVANVASARALVHLSEAEAALLRIPARPIVLARCRSDSQLAPEVAPGLAWVGVMLPGTPLHHLLFYQAAGQPTGSAWLEQPNDAVLVMTSANPGGEPLVVDNAEAQQRLASMTDFIMTHDRDIVVRADDSVMRVVAKEPSFVRRARGWVPEPVRLPAPVPSVIAVGAFLKNTVCVTRGDEAFVSQHIGDVDDARTYGFMVETLNHLLATLEVKPVAVAHDLHPDFLSTRLATSLGLPAVPVQHHVAHVASVMAEHQRTTPTVGLALDGFGLGSNGGLWGGELLHLARNGWQRLGHLKPLRQPGGDVAARQPWRMAAAALHAVGRAAEIPQRFCDQAGNAHLRYMLDHGVHSPWTTSMGRVFDAACGLLGTRMTAGFEGQAAMELESLVTQTRVIPGAWRVVNGVLDVHPLLNALTSLDAVDGANAFHGTLAAALVAWVVPYARGAGNVVALGGGCLLNAVLAGLLVEGFLEQGVRTLLPRQVPPNDGGLSLGQAWWAAWRMEG